jgi:hypothetical protein
MATKFKYDSFKYYIPKIKNKNTAKDKSGVGGYFRSRNISYEIPIWHTGIGLGWGK